MPEIGFDFGYSDFLYIILEDFYNHFISKQF